MTTHQPHRRTRRDFLATTAAAGAGLAVGCAGAPKKSVAAAGEHEEEISPGEDLMREHGILDRILLVYEEGVVRIGTDEPQPPGVLAKAAGLVRRFVEDYHEKLEEELVFPRFERAGRLVELVRVLREQHQAGRRLTDEIARLVAGPTADPKVADPIRAFVRLYRPHTAREDTVLFAAFREIVSPREYVELGEQFEEREHALFGAAGFRGVVDEVASLESALAIDDLAMFTPGVGPGTAGGGTER